MKRLSPNHSRERRRSDALHSDSYFSCISAKAKTGVGAYELQQHMASLGLVVYGDQTGLHPPEKWFVPEPPRLVEPIPKAPAPKLPIPPPMPEPLVPEPSSEPPTPTEPIPPLSQLTKKSLCIDRSFAPTRIGLRLNAS